MRFGFDLFEHLAQENGCRITIANQETLSPQREIVEDLMAVVHTFGCRLDGMRKYQKALKEEFPKTSLPQNPFHDNLHPHPFCSLRQSCRS